MSLRHGISHSFIGQTLDAGGELLDVLAGDFCRRLNHRDVFFEGFLQRFQRLLHAAGALGSERCELFLGVPADEGLRGAHICWKAGLASACSAIAMPSGSRQKR
jgi:hypothetical protein